MNRINPLMNRTIKRFFLRRFFGYLFNLTKTMTKDYNAISFDNSRTIMIRRAIQPQNITSLSRNHRQSRLTFIITRFRLTSLIQFRTRLLLNLSISLVNTTRTIRIINVRQARMSLRNIRSIASNRTVNLNFFPISNNVSLKRIRNMTNRRTDRFQRIITLISSIRNFFMRLIMARITTILSLRTRPTGNTRTLCQQQ